MPNKFKIGDKVTINTESKRLPVWIRGGIKRYYRIRTIGAIFYYSPQQHTAYYLGTNSRGIDISHYPFRAEMLKPYQAQHITRLRKTHKQENKYRTTQKRLSGLQCLLSEALGCRSVLCP